MICFNAVELFNASDCVVFIGLAMSVLLAVASITSKPQNPDVYLAVKLITAILSVAAFIVTSTFTYYTNHSIHEYNKSVRAGRVGCSCPHRTMNN